MGFSRRNPQTCLLLRCCHPTAMCALGQSGPSASPAHPGRKGRTCERVVRAVGRRAIGCSAWSSRPPLHAAIYVLPAACAFRAETLPRRQFNTTIVACLRPSLRKPETLDQQAQRNGGGGCDDDAHNPSSLLRLHFKTQSLRVVLSEGLFE